MPLILNFLASLAGVALMLLIPNNNNHRTSPLLSILVAGLITQETDTRLQDAMTMVDITNWAVSTSRVHWTLIRRWMRRGGNRQRIIATILPKSIAGNKITSYSPLLPQAMNMQSSIYHNRRSDNETQMRRDLLNRYCRGDKLYELKRNGETGFISGETTTAIHFSCLWLCIYLWCINNEENRRDEGEAVIRN